MKKLLCILISILLFIPAIMLPIGAASVPTVYMENTSANPGDTISIPLYVKDNPGMVAMRLFVEYDTAKLRLESVTDKGIFGEEHFYPGYDITENPYTLLWEDALNKVNYTGNGELAVLQFKVLDYAMSGDTEITVSCDQGSTVNTALTPVSLETLSGTITIDGVDVPDFDRATVFCSTVEAKPGESVDVPIYLCNNPGVIAMTMDVSYNADVLTLEKATDGGLLGVGKAFFGYRISDIPYTLLWDDGLATRNHQNDGLLAVLTFRVSDTAEEGTETITIKMQSNSAFDVDMTPVQFAAADGAVEIKNPEVEITRSLVMGAKVGTKVYLKGLENAGANSVTFNYNTDNTGYSKTFQNVTVPLSDLTAETDGRYSYTVWQTPAQIAEPVIIKVNGTEGLIGRSKTVNGKSYADAIMAGDYPAELKNLCEAMVLYGAECQKYFAVYKTETIETNGYDVSKPDGVSFEAFNPVSIVGGDASKLHGMSFLTLSNSALRVYVNQGVSVSNAQAGGVDGITVSTGKNGDYEYVQLSGYNAVQLDDEATLRFTAGGSAITLKVSPMAYAVAAKTTAIAKTIALYNLTAEAYFA